LGKLAFGTENKAVVVVAVVVIHFVVVAAVAVVVVVLGSLMTIFANLQLYELQRRRKQ